MKFFGRLLLGLVLLIGQMSMANFRCVCPTESAPTKSTCSMPPTARCACCRSEGLAPSGATHSHSPEMADTCRTAPIGKATTDSAQTPSFDFAQTALEGEPLAFPVFRLTSPATEAIHLAVPRIRPPDSGNQGRRAPPLF